MKTKKQVIMIIFYSVNTPEKEVKHVKGTPEKIMSEIIKYKEENEGKEIIFSANREFLTPMFL